MTTMEQEALAAKLAVQEDRRQEIHAARVAVAQAEKNLADLIKSCKHEAKNGRCVVCSTDFGWGCDKSPDGVCHYFSRGGEIELIDGTTVPTEDDHDSRYETDDRCLFCGDPYERK